MLKRLQLQEQCQLQDLSQVIDHLGRHCFAPDDSLVSKSAYYDLQLAREEMCRERLRYLEAMAIYSEAIAMVEDYHQGWGNPPQLFETLEHLMITAEAAQRLRLPLLSKDGDIHEEEIERCSIVSQSSLDSTCTSFTVGSSSNSPNYSGANSTVSAANNNLCLSATSVEEPGLGGVPNRFLGITPAYLWKTQLQQIPFDMDLAEYQLCLSDEIEARLQAKCDKLAHPFVMEDIDWLSSGQENTSDQLPERVKSITEELEREEAALKEDLYSAERRFTEYYNVLEQILGVLIKLVRNLKLQHQHKYDELQKIFLCKRCETIDAKLRSLEYGLLRDTYSKDSVPALHKIRKYLLEATKEASITHDKAVTRLHEYQSVDAHFNKIAEQYRDILKFAVFPLVVTLRGAHQFESNALTSVPNSIVNECQFLSLIRLKFLLIDL
ncbi:AUGMIN subunit 4 isoform X1 [Rosa chinensis]|uniref:AUGMIN subunit 4 isoform X1 n=1 Tax=Rosa chinensis TaxID=74649 RepID=UPI001AD8B512|nr:AUGMIN subunit 4 isoform X1 [Rosa chinensis]XP_040363336.1 AUGMIN subunit 4 isoform X1 [Rosa chinensis]